MEINQNISLAWHVAALQRRRKLPALKQILIKDKPKRQSWQQQMDIMASFPRAPRKPEQGDG